MSRSVLGCDPLLSNAPTAMQVNKQLPSQGTWRMLPSDAFKTNWFPATGAGDVDWWGQAPLAGRVLADVSPGRCSSKSEGVAMAACLLAVVVNALGVGAIVEAEARPAPGRDGVASLAAVFAAAAWRPVVVDACGAGPEILADAGPRHVSALEGVALAVVVSSPA